MIPREIADPAAPRRPAGPERPADRSRPPVPLLLVLGLGLVALLALTLRLARIPLDQAQQLTALALLLFFLGSVLRSTANGLALLFLLPPFFNGDDFHPYFPLLEVLVYLTLIRGFGAALWQRRRLAFPYAPLFLLFLASTVVSLPLNLRETWREVGLLSWPEILEGIRRSELTANLFYVRTVLNVLSGVGLYVLVVNERWTREAVLRLAAAATLVYSAVTLAGLWLYWSGSAPRVPFLSVYLHGSAAGGFSGLGFNSSYFPQYALAYLPVLALVVAEGRGRLVRPLAAGAILLAGYAILVTYQRGAWLLMLLEMGLLLAVAASLERPAVARRVALGAGAAVLLLAAGLLVLTPLGPRVVARALALWHGGDFVRAHVLGVAWAMFRDEPLLGVGAGRFAHFFQYYSPIDIQFGSWSAHNLYAQFLAEQGALGLLSFLALVGVPLGRLLRHRRELGAERPAVLLLLVSLGTWLLYGGVQYTFLMRSMQVYVWITLGLLVSVTAAVVPPLRAPRRAVAAGVAVLLVLFGLRVHAVATHPFAPGYTSGVYDWEVWDGRDARWTRRAAFLTLSVQGRVLRFAVACPLLRVVERPQPVSILLDGRLVRELTLDTPAWRTVEIPVARPVGSPLFLQVRVGYTVVPVRLGVAESFLELGILITRPAWDAS